MTLFNTITNYGPHRDIYQQLKVGLENNRPALDELLRALGLLISEYDTSIRENRLIAGRACRSYATGECARQAGCPTP